MDLSQYYLDLEKVNSLEKEIANKSHYYLPNVLNIISGLNEEECLFHYLSGKYLTKVEKYCFKEMIKEYPIFYLKINFYSPK